ncbi:MAG TPA: polyketide synthase dehydratase domain-containing protein, partial [Longimicrobiales bacterium]
RFGNAGQTDYASANDLLCKLISHLRSTRPDTRAIAIDWTGWEGIGMASRGSIPTLLKQAGMELLPPHEGVAVVRHELVSSGFRGEVVIAKGLGGMLAELDETGGVDVARLPAGKASPGPMTGKVLGMGIFAPLRVETPLDPTQQPFLFDHRIDETPVLPGVMGLEGMAEAAALLFADRRVAVLEDVRFLAPFKFHRSRERTVELSARPSIDGEGIAFADCAVIGSRLLHGQTEPEVTTHFTGRVLLRHGQGQAEPRERGIPTAEHEPLTADAIYRVYFHGPAYRVIGSAWRSGEEFVGRLAEGLPPNHLPADRPLLVAPRLIELAFQTAGLAEMTTAGRMGLPARIEKLELHCAVEEGDATFHAIASAREDGAYDVDVVDGAGKVCLTLRGYGTAALPGPVDTDLLEPLRVVSA